MVSVESDYVVERVNSLLGQTAMLTNIAVSAVPNAALNKRGMDESYKRYKNMITGLMGG